MAKQNIPIEINLVSNEFILKVKDHRHLISLYKEFNVPIVISTDDGILHTNMTEQYVLLAKRYPEVTYSDIKQYVYNSIHNLVYQEMIKLVKQLLKDLDQKI
jgi:adenosine deaminase/adenosine deaminase CECR1